MSSLRLNLNCLAFLKLGGLFSYEMFHFMAEFCENMQGFEVIMMRNCKFGLRGRQSVLIPWAYFNSITLGQLLTCKLNIYEAYLPEWNIC